jgi:hypothetical protein
MRLTWLNFAGAGSAIVAIAVAWYAGARPAALLFDGVARRELSSASLAKIGWNGTYLLIDGHVMGLTGSGDKQAMSLAVDAQGRLVATANGKSIVLGARSGTLPDQSETIAAFAADAGDSINFVHTQGRLIWPNWFEMNFMTGQTPTWKRFHHYRLAWRKASGETLTLFWRYEDYYYPSDRRFVGADMVGPDNCGLVRVEISAPR